jgi:asparagine synthase (glutamine-hydrolysing)
MSAIVGVFGEAVPRGDAELRGLLAPMSRRGADHDAVWHGPGCALAVSRYQWELSAGCSGAAMIVEDGDLVVAADASLYYRRELQRTLAAAGVRCGDTPSHLILAAYRAWGGDGVRRLEGDFAFVLFDRATQTVLCARDPGGRRPLHYAELGDTLVVASTIGGVLAHRDVPQDLNLAAIAEIAGCLLVSEETAYRSVHALRAGWLLTRQDGRTSTSGYWQLPVVETSADASFEEGAEELRELLVAAVSQRLDPAAPTSVWLSGGWDSPAVFAAGEEYFRRRGRGEAMRPVSISYPEGDSGREDELIQTVLDRWQRATHWIHAEEIPFLQDPEGSADRRDEPFVHVFEQWNRALARGSRAVDTHVALDGTGGDLLFAGSPVYLADMLRTGRWLALRREWVARGLAGAGARKLFDVAVQPLLPDWARWIGRRLYPHRSWSRMGEPALPDWIDADFARRHDLLERARQGASPVQRRSLAGAEMEYFLTHPTGPRLAGAYAGLALEEGVEARSPLCDQRVMEFAVRRPVAERISGKETKRLLRRACADWLPAEFLAPRRYRTGNTTDYAHRALRHTYAGMIGDVLKQPLLAELGIVRADVLARRWTEFLNGATSHEVPLCMTYQTELWLRAHHPSRAERASAPLAAVAACS